MKNYYEILEVNERASQEIIEKAYKILIKKYHPDLYVGEERQYAEQKVRDINEAYQVLSNDFLKSQYDMELQREKNEKIHNSTYRANNIINNDNNVRQEERIAKKTGVNFKWKSKNDNLANKNNVGTIGSMIGLLKEIIRVAPRKNKSKETSKLDFVALGLTILSLIIIGIILWFIPFTNGWMRQLIFENPLFSWIWS